jgi:hypothetical protein
MKKRLLRLLGIGLVVAGMGVLALCISSLPEANANPSKLTICSTDPEFATTSPTHVASSTLEFMTAGTGTTTLSCSTDGMDAFDLRILLKASSTKTNLRGHVAYSDNNTDWYIASVPLTENATTTTYAQGEMSMHFASSTPEDSGGNADTMWLTIPFRDIAARYTKVKLYLPPGSLNGAVYTEIVRKEQHR